MKYMGMYIPYTLMTYYVIYPISMLILMLLVLLNYFWLSDDPVKSASWYCDQHCFKIGSEVIESIWDSVIVLAPHLNKKATNIGLAPSYRYQRHARPDGLWHPLSVWHGLCISNMHRGLINADAIFKEHTRRTGKVHSAAKDCKFLMEHLEEIDFNSDEWRKWYMSQCGSKNLYTPAKTKKADLAKREEWIRQHATIRGLSVLKIDRCDIDIGMTLPPIFTTGLTHGTVTNISDVIKAYKRYYHTKTETVKGGLRYFYTTPPVWLKPSDVSLIKTQRSKGGKPRVIAHSYALDEEGYAKVKFVRR